ncbi:MAG: ATP phosphoribosyltransferase regulatory subunit HisZ [Rickettsiales bacterium]|jgi:ATP phosphoribosyltransferase regulatory subunit HisZ
MRQTDYLLPIGFYDLIGEEAKNNEKIIQIIKDSFEKENFNIIKTPLLEFDDKIDDDSFKTMDILSKKFLKIRNDITPQIIRLVETKFVNENSELKLFYIGDVLKFENKDLFCERQLTQAGIEIISPTSKDVNFYIIDIILNILEKLKLENNLVSFSVPGILSRLITKLEVSNPENLIKSIKSKDILNIKKYGEKFSDILLQITLKTFDKDLINEKILEPEKKNIKKILEIKEKIEKKYQNTQIDIDLFDDNLSFQENFGFMIFADNFKYPISRGGEYKIGQKEAAGGTIYVNRLTKIKNLKPIIKT